MLATIGMTKVRNMEKSLFPLPLVPFESMALYDTWPDYPMSCGAIFSFRGEINREAFDQAVANAVQRHPLIQANTRRKGLGRVWVASEVEFKTRWLGSEEACDFAACHPYDLRKENPARLWVQQRDREAKIFVEFHHACCDGHGGMSFMDDVLAGYHAVIHRKPFDLPPMDLNRLRNRGKFQKGKETWRQFFDGHADDLRRSLYSLLQRPQPVAHADRSAFLCRQTWSYDRLVTRTFDTAFYKQLRAEAVNQSATLNDILIARLFRSVQKWNQQGGSKSNGWLTLLIPVNLRNRADLQMPMANRLSYALLSRRNKDIASPMSELTRSVSEETRKMRHLQTPKRLLQKFAWMQQTGLWPVVFSPRRCLASTVFSNLGDPTRRFRTRYPRRDGEIQIGNLSMTRFEGTTALRPLTRAGVFLNTYANRITISTRLDPNHFTKMDAESFLDAFAAEIGSAEKSSHQAA